MIFLLVFLWGDNFVLGFSTSHCRGSMAGVGLKLFSGRWSPRGLPGSSSGIYLVVAPGWYGFPGGSDGRESTCNAGNLGWEDPLEKGMAAHSSVLAWRVPWTQEPGGLPSMELQRIGHD